MLTKLGNMELIYQTPIMTFAILILLTISIYRTVGGIKVSHTASVSGDAPLRFYGISLPDCATKCKSYPGCDNINYKRMLLMCEIVRGTTIQTIDTSEGYVTVDNTNILKLISTMFPGYNIADTISSCPEISSTQPMVVLGNMNVAGTSRALTCFAF